MAAIMNDTRIVDVEGVAVPVADQDEALHFYVGKLGFEVRRDVPMADDGRWIQVAPPGAKTTIALVLTGEGFPLGLKTGITLTTSDAESDRRRPARSGSRRR
jgi:catechol 2,3-dioxygenase-like lactoylglutathione lyase family enzyme